MTRARVEGAPAGATRALRAWERFWFEPVETSTLAVLRIAFALVIFLWTVSLAADLFPFFASDGVLPSSPDRGATWWSVFQISSSNAAILALYFALFAASFSLLVGFQTRIAAIVVFVCLVSFARRNPFVQNSGDLLLIILSCYLLFAPAGASLSVDRWRKAKDRFWEFPARAPWALRLIQVQLSILYAAAVWQKVRGATWNDGTAVSYALRIGDLERFPVPAFVTDSLVISNLTTYGTLAIELALAILVWNRKLRPWVLLLGVSLHLGIDYAVRVGFFSVAILVCYIAFIPPETMTARVLAVRERLARDGVRSLVPRLRLAPRAEARR